MGFVNHSDKVAHAREQHQLPAEGDNYLNASKCASLVALLYVPLSDMDSLDSVSEAATDSNWTRGLEPPVEEK